jgi:hypothetical protein
VADTIKFFFDEMVSPREKRSRPFFIIPRIGYFIIQSSIHIIMTIRKARRKENEKPFHEAVTDLLFSAMANHEDFVLTYEINPTTDKKEIHVMAGKLISPEMLGKLKGQVTEQLEDGSGHHIRQME